MRALVALACCAAALGGCGGGEEDSATDDEGLTPPEFATGPTTTPAVAEECGDVEVPGHVAEDVRAENVVCEAAREVAAAAQGQGREAYEAANFRCEPGEGDEGVTRYRCAAAAGEVVTFRYRAR